MKKYETNDLENFLVK